MASFGNSDQIVADYERLLEGPVSIAVRKCHVIGIAFGFSQFVKMSVFAVLYYAAAQFLQRGYISLADTDKVFMAIFCIMFGAQASGQAQSFGPDLGKAKTAAAKVFGIIDTPSEIEPANNLTMVESRIRNTYLESPPDAGTPLTSSGIIGDIEFEDVWFRYPTRKNEWVLKGLSLRIKAHETVALVGESGCGKSTMVALILRFYDVDSGRILLDGKDIKHYDVGALRKSMGLVMQEPTLFNYTIAENILYGDLSAPNSALKEAAAAANALEFIEGSETIEGGYEDNGVTLYNALHTHGDEVKELVGVQEYTTLETELSNIKKKEEEKGQFVAQGGAIDTRGADKLDIQLSKGFERECGIKGGKLSGGQKQRVAIARAIVRRPKILILDEATSALDESSQRLVQAALDNIMKDRTSIVIAHRLSTVEKCDRILVLEGGVLVEEGAFNDLRTKENGYFKQLASGMGTKKQN